MKKNSSHVNRIVFGLTLIMVLLASSCGAPASETKAPEEAGPINLAFVSWSHASNTIAENLRSFEALNPTVTVTESDASWRSYHDVMAVRLNSSTQTDVPYSSDHWLQEWVSADWIVPLDEHCPGILDYKEEYAPFVMEGATVNGKVYALPYYADLITFLYNAEQLKEAGITTIPETWEQVTEQALAIKKAGIADYPVGIALKKDDPFTMEFFYAMVYSRGGHMFDADKNPVFNQPGSAAEKTLQWLYDSVNVDKIVNPASLEVVQTDLIKLMGAGTSTFLLSVKYNLADLNSGNHQVSGKIKLGLMPGETHETNAFSRYYVLTKQATEKGPAHLDAACKLIEYLGGKTNGEYVVAKNWVKAQGLGFGSLPLYKDPEVIELINKWGDVEMEQKQAQLAHIKEGLTPWWGTWDIYAREQIQAAVMGTITPQEALKNMADRWEALKKDFTF